MKVLRYNTAIFDFDGTIVDSFLGIAKSVRHALIKTKGIWIDDLETFKSFVGPPLHHSFTKVLEMSESQAAEAIQYFRERYGTVGYRECEVYDGITEMLSELRANGIKTALASSKSEDMLKKIIVDKNLTSYFDIVLGISDIVKHETKADLIVSSMSSLSALPGETVMIGDRVYDAEGAKEAGVDFIGALYAGYGTKEEFLNYPYILLAENVSEIKQAILQEIT